MVCVHWALSLLLAAAERAWVPPWAGLETTVSSGEQVHGDRPPDSKPGLATRLPPVGGGAVGVGVGRGVAVGVGAGVPVGVGVGFGGGEPPANCSMIFVKSNGCWAMLLQLPTTQAPVSGLH